jgi:hypothetical protein
VPSNARAPAVDREARRAGGAATSSWSTTLAGNRIGHTKRTAEVFEHMTHLIDWLWSLSA